MKNSLPIARLGVLLMFFINGALFASWVSRIPQIQAKFALSEGELGLILLGLAVGVLSALSLAGGLIARYGSRMVTVGAGTALCLVLPLLALMPHPVTLWLALFVFGGAMSLMDVAMNAQAVEVERRYARPLMSSFHAAFSIGGFVGAAVGALIVSQNIELLPHFTIAGGLFLALALASSRVLLETERKSKAEASGSVLQLPSRALLPLGAVAFCCALGEGAMADWSGVYLESVVQTSASTAAFGFAVFSLFMTAGRVSGDWLARRISPVMMVRVGSVIATIGMLIAILLPQTSTVLFGFALVGAGLSVIIPLAFSAAGNMPGMESGAGIAGVATIGYAGFLAGPPVIGLIAEATSLQVSLGLIALLIGTIFFTSRAMVAARPIEQFNLPIQV